MELAGHCRGGLVAWLGPFHMGVITGLLDHPWDMAPTSPRASDSRGCVGSDDAFVI